MNKANTEFIERVQQRYRDDRFAILVNAFDRCSGAMSDENIVAAAILHYYRTAHPTQAQSLIRAIRNAIHMIADEPVGSRDARSLDSYWWCDAVKNGENQGTKARPHEIKLPVI